MSRTEEESGEMKHLSNQSANGAMKSAAMAFLYTTRTKWFMPRLIEATEITNIPAYPNCSSTINAYAFAVLIASINPIAIASSQQLNLPNLLDLCLFLLSVPEELKANLGLIYTRKSES